MKDVLYSAQITCFIAHETKCNNAVPPTPFSPWLLLALVFVFYRLLALRKGAGFITTNAYGDHEDLKSVFLVFFFFFCILNCHVN